MPTDWREKLAAWREDLGDWREMLRVGEPERWWNRNLSLMLVVLATMLFALALLFWWTFGGVIGSAAWGIRHGQKATLNGAPVKLPFLWREEDGVSHSDLHVDRPHVAHAPVEMADVDELTGTDVDFERMRNTLNSVEKIALQEGNAPEDFPLAGPNQARFVCMAHRADDDVLHVTCLTRDGRRVVRMIGPESARPAFVDLLTGLAAAPVTTH